MGVLLVYILKSAVCLAAFYLFYKCLLSRETFHRFNRFALLGVLAFSLLLPLAEVSVKRAAPIQQPVQALEQVLMPADVSGVAAVEQSGASLWLQALLIIYGIGVVFFLVRNLWSLCRLAALLRSGRRERVDDYLPQGGQGIELVVHRQEIAPFSWMRFIVISRKDLEENGREILIHERAHIRLRHSWDVLLADVCCFVQWFNPAAWLLKRELQGVHEYEADEAVLRQGVNAREYQLLLIKKAVGTRLYSMANSLNHSSLKKRITMMMKEKSNPWARMKYAYVLPLAALTMTAFARPEVSEVTKEISSAKVSNLTAIVKANPSETAPKDSIYTSVEVLPEFPGGMLAMMEFLRDNLRYPEEAKAKGMQGSVPVQFVVGKDGSISDAKVIRPVDPALDAEALRVIGLMPRWKPGMQKGKPVAVKFAVPIKFQKSSCPANGGQKGEGAAVQGGKTGEAGEAAAVRHVEENLLFVVDDEIQEGNPLSTLNADEIASVTIIKKEEAVKAFGDKGKNGVMLIRTKKSLRDADGHVKVNGYVTDEQGNPIAGALVSLEGSTTGTVSDANGGFAIAVPEGAVLNIVYVGFKQAKLTVKADPVVTVKLEKE